MSSDPAPTARALVWLGGQDFEVQQLPQPSLAPGEVLADVTLSTVCGSDRHTVSGRRDGPHPGILGHESVGTITALQPPVEGVLRDATGEPLVVGDRVVWGIARSCGHCPHCRRGLTAKCEHLMKVGHEPLAGAWPLSGGYATAIHLPAGVPLVKVPPEVPDAAAALCSCAVATVLACLDAGMATLTATSGMPDRLRVLVNGLGMLGITAVVAAQRLGAEVVATDPDERRLAQAVALGAGPAGDEQVDLAIELSGVLGGVERCLASLRTGGVTVLAGSVVPAGTLSLDPERLVRGRQVVVGVHNYEPRHLVQAVELVAGTSIGWTDFVARPCPLDELAAVLSGPPAPGFLRDAVAPGQ